ncbi:MAG: hypothetical protein H0V10_03665 [Geodermatophilaceae bacterium]|nr:hypothetical protein [Geodermatophilaceae bacterium]
MSTQPPEHGSTPSGPAYPGPTQPHGATPSGPSYPGPPPPPAWGQSPQYGQQYGSPYGGYGGGGPVVPQRRPAGVTAAAIITIVMSALTGLFWLVIALIYASSRDQIERRLVNDPQFDELDITSSDLENVSSAVYVIAVLTVALCIAAIIFAVLTLRGRNWARILVVILAALTALLSLVAVLGGGLIALIWLVAAVAVIVLLFTGGAGAWFDARAHRADAARTQY